MSKKPKQSRHRVPTITMTSDEVTDDYQAEVDASMERLRRRYVRAQKALAYSEAKADRARMQAEQLEQRQQEAARIQANRRAEEQRLTEYIERIKTAAKESRVAAAQVELNKKRDEAVARRNAQTAQRKDHAEAMRRREIEIGKARCAMRFHVDETAERRRELREIELLMMPGNYAGRAHRGTGAVHNSGSRS